VPLQSPASTRVLETTRRRAESALLGVGTALLQLPPRVAASWFTAPPARFRPPWGSAREATPRAFARGCAGRALGPPSGVSDPVSPLPTRRPRDDSPGVCAPAARTSAEDPVSPGDPCPRHLPPSGFDYPPGGFLSSAPDDGPSTAAAPMGFTLQGLAPPRQRYLSRGLASPVVLPVRPKAGGRDSRGWLQRGRGPTRRRPKAETAEPCPPGIVPLQGFLLQPPSARLPGPIPSWPAAGDAPYGPRPARTTGDVQWRKRPGLSRDCQPSWGLAPHRTRDFLGQRALRAYGFASASVR